MKMNLQELKKAYLENLKVYNALYPIEIDVKKEFIFEGIEKDNDNYFVKVFPQKAKKALKALKESADRSGNVQIWKRGDPLNNLKPDLRKRIERGLNFGI
jgi:hypothetical protein